MFLCFLCFYVFHLLAFKMISKISKSVRLCSPLPHCLAATDNKEYDAYLSYTKVDLDSLGRSVIPVQLTLIMCVGH